MAEITMSNDALEEDEPVETELPPEELIADASSLEDLDPESELWEGSPKVKQFIKWKEEYPKGVYLTSIDFDDHVVWRPMKRSEYGRISTEIENQLGEMSETEITMLNEEMICRTCVLFPDMEKTDFDDMLAGVPTLVSQQILERSGFTSIATRELA